MALLAVLLAASAAAPLGPAAPSALALAFAPRPPPASRAGLARRRTTTTEGICLGPPGRRRRSPPSPSALAASPPASAESVEGGAASPSASSASSAPPSWARLEVLASRANDALDSHGSSAFRDLKARVGVISSYDDDDDGEGGDFQRKYLRLGLVATEAVKSDAVVLSLPLYDAEGTGLAMAPRLAAKVFEDVLPEGYDGWTGDLGLLALLLLNEFARRNVDDAGASDPRGVDSPRREEGTTELLSAWIASLPSPAETERTHPLTWDDELQEVLQSSSTKKIYRLLDDADDDAGWLDERVWSADRTKFPQTITVEVGDAIEERPCFSPEGFRYALALVRSRSSFVDGSSRLLPYLDHANHDDASKEIVGGSAGTLWGSTKSALLKSGRGLSEGDEVRVSYGPKGPADYLLDHGFVPPMCRLASDGGTASAAVAELTFELSDDDRFRDDKLDVLEYETYDLAPMDPKQAFDVAGGDGATGEPDPACVQFLRLASVGGKDAFLLESIFRKEVWGFAAEPVSEENERGAYERIREACATALEDIHGSGAEADGDREGGATAASEGEGLCAMVRTAERDALSRTLAFVEREAEALDLKEYYQARRLKSLGLDSEWTPEDDGMGYGATRVPGGADYDW
ncbi:hypothetical protein ACHAWF_006172 [Thalassiosira exigua]